MAGAKKMGMNEDKIIDLVKAIYGELDKKSLSDAENFYRQSDY